MKLTKEQYAIINSTGSIKINAVAGSGKTTTLIEYSLSRSSSSRILYLAYNHSVRTEAIRKFGEKGLSNVDIHTAHSLARSKIFQQNNYKLSKGYTPSQIVKDLNIPDSVEKHYKYILAKHINDFAAYFFSSDKRNIKELNYLDIVASKAKGFVMNSYHSIEKYTAKFIDKIEAREVEVSHDFYLKKFQLSAPELKYDYILFDEGQDASPVMLDIVLRQKAVKIIVGDTHQQIYGWRHAVNSLEKVNFPIYYLSTSFRFHSDIANLAEKILERKQHFKEHKAVPIVGSGNNLENEIKAVLARTNLGLLEKVIQYVIDKNKVKRIYFEGDINTYTYANEGTSLYDVLHLYNGNHYKIRDDVIKAMKSFSDLEEYVEKTDDRELSLMVKLVQKYGSKIPDIIKKIKELQVKSEDKYKAEIVFSTVHKCKGMEYDSVQLADDFLTEEEIKNNKAKYDKNKLNEEINLLYVAVTRTKNVLHIPKGLLPDNFPRSAYIKIVNPPKELPGKETERLNDYTKSGNKKPNILKEPSNKKSYRKIQKDTPHIKKYTSNEFSNNYSRITHNNNAIPVNDNNLYGLNIGDIVEHHTFGRGKVSVFEGEFPNTKATIIFDIYKKKQLLLRIARLKKVE